MANWRDWLVLALGFGVFVAGWIAIGEAMARLLFGA